MRMERNDTIHYFVDANSSAGYVDLYDQSFGGLSRVVELSDFPDETAERLLFYLSARAQEEGAARGGNPPLSHQPSHGLDPA